MFRDSLCSCSTPPSMDQVCRPCRTSSALSQFSTLNSHIFYLFVYGSQKRMQKKPQQTQRQTEPTESTPCHKGCHAATSIEERVSSTHILIMHLLLRLLGGLGPLQLRSLIHGPLLLRRCCRHKWCLRLLLPHRCCLSGKCISLPTREQELELVQGVHLAETTNWPVTHKPMRSKRANCSSSTEPWLLTSGRNAIQNTEPFQPGVFFLQLAGVLSAPILAAISDHSIFFCILIFQKISTNGIAKDTDQKKSGRTHSTWHRTPAYMVDAEACLCPPAS